MVRVRLIQSRIENHGRFIALPVVAPDRAMSGVNPHNRLKRIPIGKCALPVGQRSWIFSRSGMMLPMMSIRRPGEIGEALRAARRQLGLTQPQLALAAGVGVRFIVDLEAGKPTVRLEHVLRVIEALGGEIQLTGLPSVTAEGHGDGDGDGA
jgi:HTH-type transcriptional regulator/antitoxin HipB